jgi:colanic acid/amylovoran biosynthesis glycosyltransferase
MRINIIVNSFPSTSETFLFNLVVELEQKGHDVTVCAFSKKNNSNMYRKSLHQWSHKIVYIPTSNWLSALLSLFKILYKPKTFIILLKKRGLVNGYADYLKLMTLSKNRPDIVHFAFSGIAVNLLPILDRFDPKIKLFVSCRGTAEKITPMVSANRTTLLSKMLPKMYGVHCVSKDMEQSILQYGLDPLKIFVNYPSINTNNFKPSGDRMAKKPTDTFHFVSTGRLNYIKGYIYAIGAIANLIKKGYQIQYKILGDGPDVEMLNYTIRERGLQHSVLLIGKVSSNEVYEHLQQADVFILPSLSEGVSNAALEAMALAIPTVSTNAGGMQEAITHEHDGWIVERFSETAIENALEHIMQNNSEAIKTGANARATVENRFTLQRQINIFEQAYTK